jgi:DnaJ-class molecular chaperone
MLILIIISETDMEHLNSHIITIESNSVTQPNSLKRIIGAGMPKHDNPMEYGDLFINCRISLPILCPWSLKSHLKNCIYPPPTTKSNEEDYIKDSKNMKTILIDDYEDDDGRIKSSIYENDLLQCMEKMNLKSQKEYGLSEEEFNEIFIAN